MNSQITTQLFLFYKIFNNDYGPNTCYLALLVTIEKWGYTVSTDDFSIKDFRKFSIHSTH